MAPTQTSNGTTAEPKQVETDYDVLIVGAGLGGINCAYRCQTELPGCKYSIIEGRSAVGGTWDLFKYPGIRSDSDLHTFGFAFRPWDKKQAIAEGPALLEYINDTIEETGIKQHIQFDTTVTKADWSSQEKCWIVETMHKEKGTKTSRAAFLLMASGYYDYKEALPVEITGLDKFKGKIIHPQFWPTDYDYSDKNVVIVGSGATAITLLPNMAKQAKQVTMLQRSPTYIVSLPQVDGIDWLASKIMPEWLSHRFTRMKFLITHLVFYNFCCSYPNAARRVLSWITRRQLPPNITYDPHFKPSYNPWSQRMCIAPDGDFYRGLHTGKCNIVTDHIETVEEDGILLKSGERLKADVIVTATGLKMQLGGRVAISVDGKPLQLSSKFLWRNAMIQDVPNLAFVVGYVNASWTLGADVTSFLVIRLIKYMRAKGFTSSTPRLQPGDPLKPMPAFKLSSTYVAKAAGVFPMAGDRLPWTARKDYFSDMRDAKHGNLTADLEVK